NRSAGRHLQQRSAVHNAPRTGAAAAVPRRRSQPTATVTARTDRQRVAHHDALRPNRSTRGAVIAWTWFALAAFSVTRTAWTMLLLNTLKTSNCGINRAAPIFTGRSRWRWRLA